MDERVVGKKTGDCALCGHMMRSHLTLFAFKTGPASPGVRAVCILRVCVCLPVWLCALALARYRFCWPALTRLSEWNSIIN